LGYCVFATLLATGGLVGYKGGVSAVLQAFLRQQALQMSEASRPSSANAAAQTDPMAEGASDSGFASADMRESAVDKTPDFPKGLHLQCPQCLEMVALARDQSAHGEIQCKSCGSQIHWMGEETVDSARVKGSGAEVGERIGRFELIERLGAGGFGEVWKARDSQLDRTVAVKIPHRGRLGSDEIEKFLREARASAQLRHPNIVSVHEVGLEGSQVYIVADFIDGLPLDKWLAGRRLAYRDGAALCQKIAAGLQHAHEEGVIHRDLKPGNIMMDRDGQPHIMDFGLAKREAGETTMTMDGQILGTPAYMSPEQAKGFAHGADRRSDIYSLGVILFELLTGERPFRGSLQMLLKQVMQDDPVSPRKLDGHVPRDLDTICLKCLQKEPARRYPTARALSEELGRYLDGKPILARPVGSLERTIRWCGRNRLVSASIAAAVFCLVFGLVATSIGYVRTSRALAKSEESRRRERKAIDDWYTQISEDTLLNQPGLQKTRKTLLLRARDYYENILSESDEDEAVRDGLALAHFRVGWITDETDSPAQAMPCYETAREMQARLLEAAPTNAERLKALGDTLNRIGWSWHKQRQLDRSLEAYQQAIDTRGRLAALTPDESESHRMLANTYMNIGLLDMDHRDYGEARRHLEQAQSIRMQSPCRGDDPKVRRDLAKGYYSLAKLAKLELVRAGRDRSLARQWCDLGGQWSKKAVELFKALTESDRADLDMHYLLAICHRMEADLAHDEAAHGLVPGESLAKKRAESVTLYQESRDILEPLARRNPDVTEYQLALAELYIRIAQIQYDQKNHPAAMESIDRAEKILARLELKKDCGDAARYYKDYTGTWYFIGRWHTDPLRRHKALEMLETWRKHLEQVVAQSPGAADVQESLKSTCGAIEIIKKSEERKGDKPN
jgi:serine/threonine protein kinase